MRVDHERIGGWLGHIWPLYPELEEFTYQEAVVWTATDDRYLAFSFLYLLISLMAARSTCNDTGAKNGC